MVGIIINTEPDKKQAKYAKFDFHFVPFVAEFGYY